MSGSLESEEAEVLRNELRDREGRLVGSIRALDTGTLECRDANGCLEGTFDPRTDDTRDAGGGLVGRGNLLAVLLARRDRGVAG